MKPLVKTLSLTSLIIIGSQANAHGENGSVGAGAGASYGLLGASFEAKFIPNLYTSFGLGSIAGDHVGYNVGLRYYLLDQERIWRPRLVANYGTNGLIKTRRCKTFLSSTVCDYRDYEGFEGTSIGFGQTLAFGESRHNGLEIDLLYKVDDGGMSDRVDEIKDQGNVVEDEHDSRLFFSIGYRFFF